MLFNEVYSCYYNTISEIIKNAIAGELDSKKMNSIIREMAFAESSIDIPKALKSEKWPLVKNDLTSVINHSPERPLTLLEKRWLKSLLSDPRIKLFNVDSKGLDDIEPLYKEDTFVKFDIYSDGDPYDDQTYIDNFKTILTSIKEKRVVRIAYTDNSEKTHSYDCIVDNIEYSIKNDKFRVIAVVNNRTIIINLSTISSCSLLDIPFCDDCCATRNKKEIQAILEDKNNALDRAMIYFSYLEKETTKIDDTHYHFKLKYFEEDEAEIIIQILSFGTNLRVTSPDDVISKINSKISNQIALCHKF